MDLINLKVDSLRTKGGGQQGISLFVVISALLILSVLTISVTAQLTAPVFSASIATQQIARENNLRSALHILRPLIRLAAVNNVPPQPNLPQLDGTPFNIKINGRSALFSLQDVNGLIDINSASPSLLTAFLVGIDQAAKADLVLKRRTERPFRTIDEFVQMLGNDHSENYNITRLITINSGQRRVNSQNAPLALLQLLSGNHTLNRAQLISQIDRRYFRVRPTTTVLVFQKTR